MKFKELKSNIYNFVKLLFFLTIFSSSLLYIYAKRNFIKETVTESLENLKDEHDHAPRYLVNPLDVSERQPPTDEIGDLIIENNADLNGQWSAPIDWSVTGIHSVLLPNETVMTFGSFGITDKEEIDVKSNKVITLSDGRKLERDRGLYQWKGHDVNSGVDFDIWDVKKGFSDSAHKVYIRPIVMDSFCSVVRVLDDENIFIIGGNKNTKTSIPDTQSATMIFNIKDGSFKRSKDLNFKRWYGSAIRTGDEKLVIVGGKDIVTEEKSIIPEIIDLKNIDDGWKLLDNAKSEKFFGEDIHEEWNYPRSYLTSDGNIVGISYNKIWLMDKNDGFRIRGTGEIPLATGGIARHLEHRNPNDKSHHSKKGNHQNIEKMKIVTMGAPVGHTSSTLMMGKDEVYIFGGKQYSKEYTSSNQVYKIDFSNSYSPKIEQLKGMSYPRSNANATILPTGEIFINGGEAYNDNEFSIFTPEIYNIKNQTSKTLSKAYFRRNYHSTSLLLPDGRILVSGGDVWNSEIFYPPYLFTRDWQNKVVLSKRPIIKNLGNRISRGKLKLEIDENSFKKISMINILSTGSTTHAQASEPKFRSLDFKRSVKNTIIVDIPPNKNELANGTYMIFAVTSEGIPSIGKIVLLN